MPADPLAEQLEAIGSKTSMARELFSLKPVAQEFITRQELSEFLIGELDEDVEEILQGQELYRTLGIIDEGVVLYDLLLSLYQEGILVFYETDEDRLYVVKDTEDLKPLDVLTYSHEYTHGLQKQHFDIFSKTRKIEDNSDRSLAYRALFEGDATIAETLYLISHMSSDEQAAARQAGQDSVSEAFTSAPHVIQRLFVFPYREGPQFVISLYTIENSWDSVNLAYERLPESTEQIIHPEKYQTGEKPVTVKLPDLVNAVGEGWTEFDRDTFGEFFLQAYIESGMPPEQAAAAAAGWGGDRFVLLKGPEDKSLLASLVTWDTTGDAVEFAEALMSFTESRTAGTWDPVGQDGTDYVMKLPAQRIYFSVSEADTLLVIAPDDATLEAVRAALDTEG